ncbi:uncharacterized protein LOC132204200 [Neocloeon triangulifer]|uniref:uncharacterized protein LOC132204200 n=1 Tax=Neocloeon triangulifer TaxID=2078957 RepID=UPI00286EEB9C|nr:uncharacterized protein LOC132204200 [Neocloeon triangulifer]
MAEGPGSSAEGRKVKLVFSDGVEIIEEVEFLREISEYFDVMFRDTFQESSMDTIELKDFSGKFVKIFLREVKEGRNNNHDLYLIVYRIMSPKIFQTLRLLMVKVDLEEIAMVTMSMAQLEEYRKIAAETGNQVLEENCLRKACGVFSEFSETPGFEMLSIEKLKMILNSKYLDCESETEVLRGVFRWLNYDIIGREEHFETALSLINWPKINLNQFQFLAETSNVVRRSKKLKDLVNFIYHKSRIEPSGLTLSEEVQRAASEILLNCRQRSLQPVCLTIQNEFTYTKNRYASMFFFDLDSNLFMDNLVCEHKESMSYEHDFDVHDFKVYLFGRLSRGEEKGLIRTRPISIPVDWTQKAGYEVRLASTREVDLDEEPSGDRAARVRTELRQVKFYMRKEEERTASDEENVPFIPDNSIDAQRSGGNFYIFHVGCDRYNIKNDAVETLWETDDGYTSCVKFPFIYSAFREGKILKLHEFDLRSFTRTTMESDFVEEEEGPPQRSGPFGLLLRRNNPAPSPPVLLSSGLSFLTPIEEKFYISEKMGDSFNDPERVSRESFHLEEELIRSGKPIVHQFTYGNDLYFLLNEKAGNDTGERCFGLYKFLGRGVGLQKIKDLPDMAVQMKRLLAKHLQLNEDEINLSNSIKFKIVNPLWVEGFKYRSGMTTTAVPMETD